MNNTRKIKNIAIVNATGENHKGDIYIDSGKIIEIASNIEKEADIVIDTSAQNTLAVPGFIDVHIHGAAGFDTMDGTQETLNGLANALPREGTTSFLATTMTQSEDAISRALENISSFQSSKAQAEMVGIHLEGPFISPQRAGAQPLQYIRKPSIELFQHWQKLSNHQIKLVTVAPEEENGLTFVEELREMGIVASIGHSNATVEQVAEAFSSGVRHATHCYNQMSPFHHREPGVIGGVLLEKGIMIEIIADFLHSHPKAVELAYRMKGSEGIILITDAMRAKGLPHGIYDLGGQDVIVGDNGAHLSDGTLAGSVLTMDQAARNMKAVTRCTNQELVAMTSTNAAKQLGLANKGSIEVGKDADITIVNEDWEVQMTICRGTVTYQLES